MCIFFLVCNSTTYHKTVYFSFTVAAIRLVILDSDLSAQGLPVYLHITRIYIQLVESKYPKRDFLTLFNYVIIHLSTIRMFTINLGIYFVRLLQMYVLTENIVQTISIKIIANAKQGIINILRPSWLPS